MSNLTAIRDDYIRRFRPRARAEAEHFARGPLADRIARAAQAVTSSGAKHKHQWRIPPATLATFAANLTRRRDEIMAANSFAQLFAILDAAKPAGVGELTVYDTAVRIGHGQNLQPDAVYLHAGTRKGAKRLNLGVRRSFIPHAEIPTDFAGLSAAEVEDVLCTYAPYLGANAKKFPSARCGTPGNGCGPDREPKCP